MREWVSEREKEGGESERECVRIGAKERMSVKEREIQREKRRERVRGRMREREKDREEKVEREKDREKD